MKRLATALLGCALTMPAAADASTVRYGPRADQLVDVSYPVTPCPCPLLVWFHGGSFITGSRKAVPESFRREAVREGFAFASVDYSLQKPWPAAHQDALAAIRRLRVMPAVRGQSVMTCGSSAGGALALWVALQPVTNIAATCGLRAQTSFVDLGGNPLPRALADILGEHAGEASPASHVTPNSPPVALYYLPQDNWIHNAARAEPLLDAGADVTLIQTADAPTAMRRLVAWLKGRLP